MKYFLLTLSMMASMAFTATAYADSEGGWICKISHEQSEDFWCRYSYKISKFALARGADEVITEFKYDNTPEPNNVGCLYGGTDNGGAARQLKNAKVAAKSLKDAGICKVVIQEF